MDVQSCESKDEEVMGEGIVESEMEELVPEWGWKGADSRDKMPLAYCGCVTSSAQKLLSHGQPKLALMYN